tara:strand:+ start:456 stop:1010 length:555 start_codon:yes stop_codon:yes gene_type:complete
MADSPVTINKPGTMAQAAVAATAPEGMLIAPIWKRVVALGLDGFLISIILWFFTQGMLFSYVFSISLLTTSQAPFVLGSWVVLLTFYWLYFKYTGRQYGRSLGQRAMRIAIVHDDGSLLGINHWGRRAAHKLRYIIPILGQAWGIWDVYKTWRHETKRSPVDLANHTVAAVDWSLPVNTRNGLR